MSRLLIQCIDLTIFFNSQPLFTHLDVSIHEGERFVLLGENGAGKTTLLRLLMGELQADAGAILRADGLTIGTLPQQVELVSDAALVRDYLQQETLGDLEKQMTFLESDLTDPKKLETWGILEEEYARKGGYRRLLAEDVLKQLKIQPDAKMGCLSSGERVRVALAKLLITPPDLLLLDEPTNHLDQKMMDWLKRVLQGYKGAVLVVSHDRNFLNTTCNRLLAIEEQHLQYYGGNYDFYLCEQERLENAKLKAYAKQQKERSLLKQKIREISYARPQAKSSSDRNKMAYDKRGELYQQSLAVTLDRLKNDLTEIEEDLLHYPKAKSIRGIRFNSCNSLSSLVAITLENVSISFTDKPLLSSFTKILRKGDRVVITGPNGSGKTTLLRAILGLHPLDEGVIRIVPSAKIAYLDQEGMLLSAHQTPIAYFGERFGLSEEALRRELHMAALGSADLLHRSFASMSVGQRKRFMLLTLILEKPHVILLDEPTNHLDLLTVIALEKALLTFEGALLAVSHDLVFIDKIATQRWDL